MDRHAGSLRKLGAVLVALTSTACGIEPDAADVQRAVDSQVDVYFNAPGASLANAADAQTDDVLVQTIDQARTTIDLCVYGLSRRTIIEALIRAHERGVQLRMVGDARSMGGYVGGYVDLDRLNIPMQVGNQNNIMHNKFFIIDGHRVFVGTGNITSNSFDRDNNNWVIIDSPAVAADFTAEFEQMFEGRFGPAKQRLANGEEYTVGDAQVEVRFSPQEDALGRLLQAIGEADESLRFFIFAFTKDQVGSAIIAKHHEFQQYNACCDPAADSSGVDCLGVLCEEPYRRRFVQGVIDQSQLHSNGPYHELYRLVSQGVDIVLDGNDSNGQAGDYQAGGGRQHDKTMVIDAGRADGMVVTGSFNWSSSATQANDETLLVIHSERLGAHYGEHFDFLYAMGRRPGHRYIGDGSGLRSGDIVFNEIHWDGYNGDVDVSDAAQDLVYNDEFIELLNTRNEPVDLSLWTIATDDDFTVGFYPGTVIGPYERYLIVDHNIEPYRDDTPQQRPTAFANADFIMNVANDPRFLRLNLHNLDFRLRLLDPRGNVIDTAGDGGPAFTGGRRTSGEAVVNRSMERIHVVCPDDAGDCAPIGDGSLAASWQACQLDEGGANVTEAYRSIVLATPGEPNSGGEQFPDQDPMFRVGTGAQP